MKLFKNYMSALLVFALLLTSCSKEESSALDDADANFVELTFGATLNDLDNRAANKSQHFDDIPTCLGTAPSYATINFSYGGNDYEIDVDILQDSDGYFTDYSEALKIPVPLNGSTTVTLTGFQVFDNSDARIWAAPVGSALANYVDQVLPRNFDVAAGTKPYIDVEVLCFDRRLANEYGYVFFDIIPETIYPLCTFINYCNEAGRHWVANYSLDLYFGTDATGIQLYDNADADAQVAVGTRNGQFYADPLCLVVPGPPANLANDQPYLYMIIYPNDWTGNYNDINNTPVPVQLSWNDVNALLNNDGTTNEYLHLFIGECEGALEGDGTITPPPPPCNPDNDDADCDNDGILNGVDACPDVWGDLPNGCPDETTEPDPCANLDLCSIPQTQSSLDAFCYMLYADFANPDGFVEINSNTVIGLENSQGDVYVNASVVGTITNGNLSLTISLDGTQPTDRIKAYEIEVRPALSGDCFESQCNSNVIDTLQPTEDQEPIVLVFDDIYSEGYPVFIRIKAVVCEQPVTGP